MNFNQITLDINNAEAKITLKNNDEGLCFDLISEIISALNIIRSNKQIEILYVLSACKHYFNNGINRHVLDGLISQDQLYIEDYCNKLSIMMYEILSIPCLTIVCIEKNIKGLGIGIALPCDIIIMRDHTSIELCETNAIDTTILYPYIAYRTGHRVAKIALTVPISIGTQYAYETGITDFISDDHHYTVHNIISNCKKNNISNTKSNISKMLLKNHSNEFRGNVNNLTASICDIKNNIQETGNIAKPIASL